MDLSGKRVAITGANGALGRAVAARAALLGGDCLLIDIDFAPDLAGPSAHRVDLGDRAATAACLGALGRVDVLFNVAGGFAMGERAWEADEAAWNGMFAINVRTLQNAVRAVVPGMLESGRGAIVNVGALGALKGQAHMSAYTAAKSVVLRLTESLSAELREKGINVNAVLPSLIDTPRNRADMPDADHARWVKPDDLAAVICFLGSEAARAVHGALVPVTGLV
jgi:NAD(P)-dependent dehydrogenase (short-subunit alcohol dehydrogenase family)